MERPLKVFLLGMIPQDEGQSIRRYRQELVRHLQGRDSAGELVLTPTTPRIPGWVSALSSGGRGPAKASAYITRFLLYPRQVPRIPGAIYHLLDQSLSHLVSVLDRRRSVATCHDLLHFPLWELRRRTTPVPIFSDRLYRTCVSGLPQCARVIAVSEQTKKDLVRYLRCDPQKVVVIHEGISPVFLQPPAPGTLQSLRSRLRLPPGFLLLHVGVPAFYKNLEGLLTALAHLSHTLRLPVTLLRVGPPLSASQRRLANRLRIRQELRELGVLEDDALRDLYHLSDLLVHPSWYEGFGFPPLEAMACGLPVVASDRGALSEILADAALWVDPEDPIGMAQTIRRALEDTALRETMRARGLRRSQLFRWEHCAQETLRVYRSLGDS